MVGGACSARGADDKCALNFRFEKPDGKRLFRWKDDIKIYVREIWLESVDLIHLT